MDRWAIIHTHTFPLYSTSHHPLQRRCPAYSNTTNTKWIVGEGESPTMYKPRGDWFQFFKKPNEVFSLLCEEFAPLITSLKRIARITPSNVTPLNKSNPPHMLALVDAQDAHIK